ncbi:MAG: alkyl hydroperoxide reductase subunit F [Myxococcota bacterium]|jgi:alkyl hydroperoxide reductase subunit F
MLDDALKAQFTTYLQHLKGPLELSVWLDGSQASKDTRALLTEVAACSPLVSVAPGTGDAERVPSFGIHAPGEKPRVFFAGLPLGHEVTSLLLALLHVSGHPPKVSGAALAQAASLAGPLRFETYFSATCQNCPDIVQALNILAAKNPNIEHVAIDGSSFQSEVEDRQIMAVPTVFLNGAHFGQGRMEIEDVLDRLDTDAAGDRVKALNDKDVFDMLIVGGGPAGAAAAIYAARKGISTGIVAERFGGQLMDTLGIENFPSVLETEGPRFARDLEAHVLHYPVDIIKRERAGRLVPAEEPGGPIRLMLENGATLSARSLILATGARWRNIGVPGEEKYRTKGVTYCPHCDGPLFKGKRVAVIGGGNSGVEAAIDLAGVVDHVTVLEFMGELKADAVLVRKLRSLPNVDVVMNARTTEVLGDGDKVNGLQYEDRTTSDLKTLDVAGVFVQIGLLPNTEWLRESPVELSKHGEIVVDDRGRTSVPGVFAAGDVTTVPFKQIVIATGDGARAALGAFDHLIRSSAPSESAA